MRDGECHPERAKRVEGSLTAGSISHDWNPWDGLTAHQLDQLSDYEQQLLHFNRTHNLISPTAAEYFRSRHLTHVLSLRWKTFPPGSTVVDWGTGGGLPAIPLAIAFPEVNFYAVDTVRKKAQSVRMIARRLGLENLEAWHGRAEAWPGRAHYSVSRATAPLAELWKWHARIALPLSVEHENVWAPGLICLKGGDLREEIASLYNTAPDVAISAISLKSLQAAPDFQEKHIIDVSKAD